jgi:DNA invertase Pin-like site-specific DNA recombinase
MTQYVAYYRVSTDKQGLKGLGMDAQREAVSRFMTGKGELAAQFIEVESGKKSTNRPPFWSSPSLTGSPATSISFPA